ncbi:spore coat protein [archaeon]|nr:spore coat protein [archaeon]|tara:strand:+ start:430 stop:876 length:447 start_codon:yes stop_codon:yes gene_type:complete
MIEGVKIKKLEINEDPRGDFREIVRSDGGIIDKIEQISIGRTLPGVIKAFHGHENQDDLFYVLKGNIQLVLYDIRENSQSKDKTEVILLGESYEPKIVFIPRNVLHGYKVLGDKEAEVLYIMNNKYNSSNPDEKRIPFDDPSINFDWN